MGKKRDIEDLKRRVLWLEDTLCWFMRRHGYPTHGTAGPPRSKHSPPGGAFFMDAGPLRTEQLKDSGEKLKVRFDAGPLSGPNCAYPECNAPLHLGLYCIEHATEEKALCLNCRHIMNGHDADGRCRVDTCRCVNPFLRDEPEPRPGKSQDPASPSRRRTREEVLARVEELNAELAQLEYGEGSASEPHTIAEGTGLPSDNLVITSEAAPPLILAPTLELRDLRREAEELGLITDEGLPSLMDMFLEAFPEARGDVLRSAAEKEWGKPEHASDRGPIQFLKPEEFAETFWSFAEHPMGEPNVPWPALGQLYIFARDHAIMLGDFAPAGFLSEACHLIDRAFYLGCSHVALSVQSFAKGATREQCVIHYTLKDDPSGMIKEHSGSDDRGDLLDVLRVLLGRVDKEASDLRSKAAKE